MNRYFQRVIDPALNPVGTRNYVLGDGLDGPGLDLATPQDGSINNAYPQNGLMCDGRVASVGDVPAAAVEEQPAWGWGYMPAQAGEPVDQALTDLVMDPYNYTDRQQDAVRRDLAAQIQDYTDYSPSPFAAQDPLGFDLIDGTDAPKTPRTAMLGAAGVFGTGGY